MTKRKRHTAQFKFFVALDAAKEVKTLNELAAQHSIHPAQISQWKKLLLEEGCDIFLPHKKNISLQKRLDELYRMVGEITMERDWLKKKLHLSQ
jgi:transposase-like protein